MDWQTIITVVLINSLGTTIAVGVVGFVARSLFGHILSRDIAKFEAHLQIETERHRAELEKAAFEHQTRFSNLHVKRAEVIAEMYSLLTQAVRDVSLMAKFYDSPGESTSELSKLYDFLGVPTSERPKFYDSPGESTSDEKFEKAFASTQLFQEYFEKNRIYFSQSMCEKIDSFGKNLSIALLTFQFRKMHMGNQEKTDYWIKVWELIDKEISPLKSEIESEFREMLGISSDK
jgi:hypothetical protein